MMIKKMYAYMSDFKNFGVNIWYDEGIPPAGEWVEEIANAIKRSSLFVVFISLVPWILDMSKVRLDLH